MAATARKLSHMQKGVDKTSFNTSLQYLSDQLRWAEQKLTMKVDETIEQDYHNQQQKLKHEQMLKEE